MLQADEGRAASIERALDKSGSARSMADDLGRSPAQIADGRATGFRIHPSTIYHWIAAGYAGMSNAEPCRKVGCKPRKAPPRQADLPQPGEVAQGVLGAPQGGAGAGVRDGHDGGLVRKPAARPHAAPAPPQGADAPSSGREDDRDRGRRPRYAREGGRKGAFRNPFEPILTNNGHRRRSSGRLRHIARNPLRKERAQGIRSLKGEAAPARLPRTPFEDETNPPD